MAKKIPRILIVCVSRHRGNTLKIASALTEVLSADLISPAEFSPELVASYDLLGFGSGVYRQHLDSKIREAVSWLSKDFQKPVFIFSTSMSGIKEPHQDLKAHFNEMNYPIIGEFSCRGKMTYGLLKFFGGINPTRPNTSDLEAAVSFAQELLANPLFNEIDRK